jgi:hypothetical protein
VANVDKMYADFHPDGPHGPEVKAVTKNMVVTLKTPLIMY